MSTFGMHSQADTITVQITVHGVVQGVGYRYFVSREARKRGISGWVKNCADGSVEVQCVGKRALLGEFRAALRRGPYMSNIDSVDWRELPAKRHELFGRRFEIRY